MQTATWLIGIAFSVNLTLFGQTALTKEPLPPPPEGQQWKLVWSDEFDGTQLNETKWNRLGDWKRRDGFWVKDDAYLV
jgi:beta-glucanase (GH16 family)